MEDLAIDQHDIEKICTKYLTAWKGKDANACYALLSSQYQKAITCNDLEKMIHAVDFKGMDWDSYGGMKPDSDPFDVSVTVGSSDKAICPVEFRFGIKRDPLDITKLTISSMHFKPALHIEQATRAFIENWRMGNTEDILSMMTPALRENNTREQLLQNIVKMGKLSSIGLPGQNMNMQRRENIEFDDNPYHVSVKIRSEDRENTFRLTFTNVQEKSFPKASLSKLTYFDDRPKPDGKIELLPESKMNGAFTFLSDGGNGRGWVSGSKDVEGGFGHGRFIEDALGNKDIRYMSGEQLEIYQETLDENKISPDDALGDEVCLAIDMGSPLREIPRYKLNPLLIRRRKTDTCCLFILFLFWVFIAFVSKHAIEYGDTNRLLFGVDSLGNTCGSTNSEGSKLGVDLTNEKYLWWPDSSNQPRYMMCISKCPGVGDLNSTTYTDYMVKIMDQNAPIKTYIVQTATTSVLNRCIPEDGGENLKIGNDLIVLADLLNGWKTILVSGSIALICGFTWLMLITRFPRIVVTCTVFGTFMTALGIVAGLVLIAYPSTRSIAKNVVDPTASIFTMVSLIALFLFTSTFFYRFCRKRKLAKYAWPIMDELSHAIKRIGSGFIMYPIINFFLFAGLGIGGCLLMVQILSLGKIKQICECPKNSLTNCKCTQVFEFDPDARFYAAITLIGMLWHQNILLELTRCTISGTLSVWFFTDDDEESGKKLLPMFPTYKMFSRIFWNHLGTIAYIAFIRPFHMIHQPLLDCMDYNRRKPTTSEFRRKCLGLTLLKCCCWDTMQYANCDAALVQVALHGYRFREATTVGAKLWMRNKRRVYGMQSFILLSVQFGTCAIFLFSCAIAVYTSNNALGTSSPIAVLLVTAIVVFAIARAFTIIFSMVTKSFMLNFLEDAERNGMDEEGYTEDAPYVAGGKIVHPGKPASHKQLFMPKKLKKLLDAFNYLLDDRPPTPGEAIHELIKHKLKDLTLVHSNSNCRLMRRSHVAQTTDNAFYDSNKPWRVSATIPYRHEQQPAGSVKLFVYEPTKATSWCGLFKTGGLREVKRVPQDKRLVQGPYNYEYDCENIKGAHPHLSPEQQEEQKISRLSLMVETITVRCSIHLMTKKDAGFLMDDPTRVRPVTQLSAKEKKELSTPSDQEGPVFLEWIKRYRLKWDKNKQTDYQFAAEVYVTFQNHFYYYKHKDHPPTTLDEIAAGDTAVCGTSNHFFVSLLRHFGIPARCIGGHWLTGNEDNSRVVKFNIGGEMLAIDFSDHCKSEFYAEGLGWLPSDCTAQRIAAEYDPQIRRAKNKHGKKAWDQDFMKKCLGGFGQDGAMLLLGGNGTPSIYQNSDTMSRAHESTEINLMEGQFMATLEKEMKNQPWMPVCTPEHLSCP